MVFKLSIPVGINQLYKQAKGHWYKDKRAVDWIEEALWEIKRQKRGQVKSKESGFGSYVEIEWHFKDKRIHDIDGPIKVCLDVLVKAGIIKDDNDITKLVVTKYPESDKNYCMVEIL